MASSISSVSATLVPHPGLSSVGQGARPREEGAVANVLDPQDTVASPLRSAREAARGGLAALSLSGAAARQASALLDEIAAAAEDGRTGDVQSLAERLRVGVQSAIAGGASLLTGQNLTVAAGADGAGLQAEGLDLRFAPPPEAAFATPEGARTVGSAAAQAAREAREFAARWEDAQKLLSAHEGVLAAAQASEGRALRDLDADGARLMALQVRQSLSDAGGLAIANNDPRAILALFKS